MNFQSLRSHWVVVVVVCGLCLETAAALRGGTARVQVFNDPAFFQHAGWYVTQGAVPYVDFWDVKPPVVYYLTTTLSVLVGGDPFWLHVVAVGVTIVAVVAGATLAGTVTARVTDSWRAGVVATATLYTLPAVYTLPRHGIRVKFLLLPIGLACVASVLRRRHRLAGVFGAVAVGTYLTGVTFLLVGVLAAAARDGRRAAATVAGVAALAGLALAAPVVALGAGPTMIVQTVLVPLATSASPDPWQRVAAAVIAFGPALVLAPVAYYGLFRRSLGHGRTATALLVGAVVFGLKVAVVDMEGPLDAVSLWGFVAVGVGVVAAELDRETVAATCVAVLVVGGLVWSVAPLGVKADLAADQTPTKPIERPADLPDVRTIYWDQHQPDTCHYRLSAREQKWLVETNAAFDRSCRVSLAELGDRLGLG